MIKEVYDIFSFFEKNKVEYLVIGGFAVNIYGYSRNTGDLDIYLHDTIENRKKLNKSLEDANLIPFPNVESMQFIAGYTEVSLPFGIKMDIMTSVKGLEKIDFNELLKNATRIDFFGNQVNFIDFDHLILAKRTTNRPKDLLDIEELKKINPDLFEE